jgi:hypothetical protein
MEYFFKGCFLGAPAPNRTFDTSFFALFGGAQIVSILESCENQSREEEATPNCSLSALQLILYVMNCSLRVTGSRPLPFSRCGVRWHQKRKPLESLAPSILCRVVFIFCTRIDAVHIPYSQPLLRPRAKWPVPFYFFIVSAIRCFRLFPSLFGAKRCNILENLNLKVSVIYE